MKRILIIALVMVLAFYPVAELTRVIWTVSYVYDPGRLTTWIAETAVIWSMYLAIIPVLLRFLRPRVTPPPGR